MTLTCQIPIIRDYYARLRKDGVENAAIDTGYGVDAVGAGDGKVTCEEVLEYIFNDYERYSALIDGISGYPPTWVIKDEQVLKKIREAIDLISSALVENGIRKGTDEFQKRLAIGLFHLTYAPTHDQFSTGAANSVLWNNIEIELLQNGLKTFADWLKREGGFGLSLVTDDAEIEASAEDTIKNQKGFCTEESKVVYAVFREAGLKPFFAGMTGTDMEKAWDEYWHGKVPVSGGLAELQTKGHVVVGLTIGGITHYFDANNKGGLKSAGAPYGSIARRVTLREFRILESTNILSDVLSRIMGLSRVQSIKEEAEAAAKLYRKTTVLGTPPSWDVGCYMFISQARILRFIGDVDGANRVLDEGAEVCINNPGFYINRADVLAQKAMFEAESASSLFDRVVVDALCERMKSSLLQALSLDPSNMHANLMLSEFYLAKSTSFPKWSEDAGKYMNLAKRYCEAAYRVDNSDVYALSCMFRHSVNDGNYAEAEEFAREIFTRQPNFTTADALADILLKQGKIEEAIDVWQRLLLVDIKNHDIYSKLAVLYLQANRNKEYHLMSYMSSHLRYNGRFSSVFSFAVLVEDVLGEEKAKAFYALAAEELKTAFEKKSGEDCRQDNGICLQHAFFWLLAQYKAGGNLSPVVDYMNKAAELIATLEDAGAISNLVGSMAGIIEFISYRGLNGVLKDSKIKNAIRNLYKVICNSAEKYADDDTAKTCFDGLSEFNLKNK